MFSPISSYHGKWTATHQMTLNGKRDDFAVEDFEASARAASMKRGRAREIVGAVQEVVRRWRDYADEASVAPAQRDGVWNALRLEPFF